MVSMRETDWNFERRLLEPAHLPDADEGSFLLIDLSDARGWAELESPLPEGTADDLTGHLA
jgi:hypothetical protein